MVAMSDSIIAQLAMDFETNLTERFNSELPQRGERGFNIAETLGMEPEAFRAALQEEGATIASVIEANGGDVSEIVSAAAAEIAERTGGDVAEIEAQLTERFNSEKGERDGRRGGRGGRGGFPGGGQGGDGADAPETDGTNS